ADGAAKPTVPGAKPAAQRPADGAAKPGAPKPADGAARKPAAPQAAKKPAAARPKDKSSSGGRRKIGQGLLDPGYLDDDQLWAVPEEAKTPGQLTGQVAITRGLITEEQLLQALAEQHGLKVANLEEAKPTPEAIQLVPEPMATVYKILPLTFKDKVLS